MQCTTERTSYEFRAKNGYACPLQTQGIATVLMGIDSNAFGLTYLSNYCLMMLLIVLLRMLSIVLLMLLLACYTVNWVWAGTEIQA